MMTIVRKIPAPVLTPLWRGRASLMPAPVQARGADGALISVSIAPEDLNDSARERLLDEILRVMPVPARCAMARGFWRSRFRPLVEAAYPGSLADCAQCDAPAPPLEAVVWQLADDPQTYGEHAGAWIVVDGTLANELTEPVASCEEAQRQAGALNAADVHAEWYRHWFLLRWEGLDGPGENWIRDAA